MNLSFAVLFKTHFWDDFTQRQLERVKNHLGNGDLYVVVDESIEKVPAIAAEKAVRITSEDFKALGLAEVSTHGSVIWYNIDYPNYIAFSQLPKYDFYICIEYDAVITVDLEGLVAKLSREGVDYLGFPIRKPARDWPWYDMHLPIYGPDMLVNLSCFAIFSHRAMAKLLTRRQEMTTAFKRGDLNFWPNNEAFIANEIQRAGMVSDTLEHYGNTSKYDWWPPTEESELSNRAEGAFIHPVLCGQRYAKSIVHHEPSFVALMLPKSALHQKLKGISASARRRLLLGEVKRRLTARIHRTMETAGLRRRWFAKALSGAGTYDQTKPVHNSEA